MSNVSTHQQESPAPQALEAENISAVVRVLLAEELVEALPEERAAAAGVSVTEWAQATVDVQVQAACLEALRGELLEALPGILRVGMQTARKAGREGYMDRKLLLEMGGLPRTTEASAESGLSVEYIGHWRDARTGEEPE